jgi:hypothetical protein
MKNAFNKIAVGIFVIVLLGVMDVLVKTALDSSTVFRALPGTRILASGRLAVPLSRKVGMELAQNDGLSRDKEKIDRILSYEADSKCLSIDFIELQGQLWRAYLEISPRAPAGQCRFFVFERGVKRPEQPTEYRVSVYPSQAKLSQSLPSVCQRFLGIDPLWVVLGGLPFALACFLIPYWRPSPSDAKLAQGIGPIYKMAKRKTGWELVIGLGAIHGLTDGDKVAIETKEGQIVAEVAVIDVKQEICQALVSADVALVPGLLARKHG